LTLGNGNCRKKFLDKKLFGCLMENQDLGREEKAFSLKNHSVVNQQPKANIYNKKQKCIQPITITLLAFSEFVKKPHRLRISTCLPLENARWF